jgi:hypothetical protein
MRGAPPHDRPAVRTTAIFFLQVTQDFSDRRRAADTGSHGILHEPLSGVRVEDGIAQMTFEDRELWPTSRRLAHITQGWALPSRSWRLSFVDRVKQVAI